MPTKTVLLTVKNVSKTYPLPGGEVLKDISFTLNSGEVAALIGPSGAGKTTLFNILGGLDNKYEGTVIINGKNIKEYNPIYYRRHIIGTIFQQFYLLPTINALENVAVPLWIQGIRRKKALKQAKDMIKKVYMLKHKDKYPKELSGGQAQRIAVARALITSPKLILADEPTGNLDTKTGKRVVDLILKMVQNQKDKAAIIITHDPMVIEHIKKRIYIRDGKIIKIE